MNLIKLGKKGQVSIPQGVLRQLGIAPDSPLLVETTEDGAILLRQVSVHPVEMYSDARLAEFELENAMTPAQARRFGPQIANFSGWLQTQAPAARAMPHVAQPVVAYRSRTDSPAVRAPGEKKATPASTAVRSAAEAPAARASKR